MNQDQLNIPKLTVERDSLPNWMVFLLFLAYLRATRPASSTILLITFVRAVTFILITLILALVGGSEILVDLFGRLHF
jgi:hypothetical protein